MFVIIAPVRLSLYNKGFQLNKMVALIGSVLICCKYFLAATRVVSKSPALEIVDRHFEIIFDFLSEFLLKGIMQKVNTVGLSINRTKKAHRHNILALALQSMPTFVHGTWPASISLRYPLIVLLIANVSF